MISQEWKDREGGRNKVEERRKIEKVWRRTESERRKRK